MLKLGPLLLLLIIPFLSCAAQSDPLQNPRTVRQHSDESFQKLRQEETTKQQEQRAEAKADLASLILPVAKPHESDSRYPEEQYLIVTGHGLLTKGHLVCQRVSETEARAELAKQIRVLVKEHAIDRVRERTGKPVEQDIEIVREELVNELLRDVKIVDRTEDQAAGTCSSTAVMPKSHLAPKLVTSPEAGPMTP